MRSRLTAVQAGTTISPAEDGGPVVTALASSPLFWTRLLSRGEMPAREPAAASATTRPAPPATPPTADREARHSGEEQPFASQEVREPSAGQQEATERKRVAGHHPQRTALY